MVFGVGGYKASKLKPQLKMAVTRLQINANKKSALMKQQIREIAVLLADTPPKEEKARIKAEALIRDDNTVEAYEILQLNCELLSERIHLISHSKECPPDLVSCISTVIWASAIVDIPELLEVRKQFRYKYGKEFDQDASMNVGGVLNDRVTSKLSVQPPSAFLVQTYLEKIADEHEVDWKPKAPLTADKIAEPMPAPEGYSVPVAPGSGLNPSAVADPNALLGGSALPSSKYGDIPAAPSVAAGVAASKPKAYTPVLPTPASPNVSTKIDHVEEEDIYVPGAPKGPPGGKRDEEEDEGGGGEEAQNRARTQSAGEGSDGPPAAGDESYDDLAARFAMLQK
ncbi:hypothetical protein ACHAXT_012094 [Thalassiosira profunda]